MLCFTSVMIGTMMYSAALCRPADCPAFHGLCAEHLPMQQHYHPAPRAIPMSGHVRCRRDAGLSACVRPRHCTWLHQQTTTASQAAIAEDMLLIP